MDPIVQAAAVALVQAISTDAWQQAKEAVVDLWHRGHSGDADLPGRDLDELRAQVLQARSNGDAQAERVLEGQWQVRLQALLRGNPALAADLRQVLDSVLMPTATQAGATGAIVMTGTSRDSSSFTQIGSQVNYDGRP
jgi:hypothetical protein